MTKMMKGELRPFRTRTLAFCLNLASALLMVTAAPAFAQRLTGRSPSSGGSGRA